MKIVISSGHALYVRGASGLIDEVDEARRVVPRVAELLRRRGIEVVELHDNTSTTQDQNLKWLVDAHNSAGPHELDVSCHFNAYVPSDAGRGVEVLYISEYDVAERICKAIAEASGLINRGPHYRDDLYWLRYTTAPAVLLEICFVDSVEDVENCYQPHFDAICQAIANVAETATPRPLPWPPRFGRHEPEPLARFAGKVSWFGGPDDTGVDPDEGLAFIYEYEQAKQLFLKEQPPGTTGLARRLNPAVPYVACRWDYAVTPKEMLADALILASVRAANGREFFAWPADWGPHEEETGRAADISPGLMEALQIETDDEVEVIYPAF